MTNFTIDGNKQNGLTNEPRVSMNIVRRRLRTKKELALINYGLTRAEMNNMLEQDLKRASNKTPAEIKSYIAGVDLCMDAANPELTNLMGRF